MKLFELILPSCLLLLSLLDCVLALALSRPTCSPMSSYGLFITGACMGTCSGTFLLYILRKNEKNLLYATVATCCVSIASCFFCLGQWFGLTCKSEALPVVLCINFILLFCATIATGYIGIKLHEKIIIPTAPASAIEFE